MQSSAAEIRAYYRTLFQAWGRQYWWPAQSRFEVIVGAYLTQNTAWANVEKALRQLRRARRLSLGGIRSAPVAELESLIRPAGYFRQKTGGLKTFVAYLDERYGGSLDGMFARPTAELRQELLHLKGVGPETADSILLYAGNHAVFVVDAYTRRILERHGLIRAQATYGEIQEFCGRALAEPGYGSLSRMDPRSSARGPRGSCHAPSRMSRSGREPLAQIYGEMHGLLVGVAKHYCRKPEADCADCPLRPFLRKAPQALTCK